MASFLKSNRVTAGLAAIVLLSGLSGCADYLNNWDSSSARTGNANYANTAIQEIEPWPPAAYRSTVGSGG